MQHDPTEHSVNGRLLPAGTCFGCGHGNSSGLGVEIFQDAAEPQVLRGRLSPTPDMAGFPGITHGGAVFTAMDCMASWSGFLLVNGPPAIWVLRNASVTYHAPPSQDGPINLAAELVGKPEPGQAAMVKVAAHGTGDRLVTAGEFKIIPLSEEKFLQITGLGALPPGWREFMASL